VDFRNNVIFNWGANSSYGAEGGRYNYIGNYYKPTANSSNKGRILSPNADIGDYKQAPGIWGSFFLSGNYVDGKPEVTKDNILGFQPSPVTKNKSDLLVNKPFETPFVSTQSAVDAYREVLADAGASFRRDKTDTRIVDEVARGLIPLKATRDYGTKAGFIDSQNDVGGWDNYCYDLASVPLDSNIDGIPDGWLEKNFPGKKANDTNSEGYTYLEVYLNNLLLKNN
jgi:hypothetical protein